jgi:hypothetical protein
MKLDSTPYLKAEHLLIDADPLPRYPHLLCIVVKLVKETLHLPQWILCSLLLGIFAEVEHAHKTLEVLPPSETLNSSPSLRELLAHCACNEVIAIEFVTLEPHANPWLRRKAVHKQEPDHLVDLGQIKRFKILKMVPPKLAPSAAACALVMLTMHLFTNSGEICVLK